MDVKYQYWQNTHISKTVFNWTHVAANRLTDLPKEKVVQLPINWYNMDSKNYWRNQHTIISVEEVKAILEFVLDEKNRVTNSNLGQPATSSTNRKFLMFMPWEQLNNQILGVKSACAVSNLLNRTLVLPYLGYKRITGWKTQRKYRNVQVPFVATDYEWKPFDRYYNASKLLSLPCSTISLDNFISWNNGQSIQEIRYHPLGGGATSEKQLREYYSRVLGLTYESVEWDKNVYFQLRKEKIFRVYGNNSAPVMALGSMFMHYDFGLRQNYPIQKFYDYLSPTAGSPDAIETGLIITTSSSSSVVADGVDINYLQILKALDFSDRLKKVRDRLFDQHRIHLKSGRGYVAIHLRRGDYLSKCNEIKELIGQKSQEAAERAFERCFVPAHLVNQVVPYLYPPETYPIIYVATNADKDAKKEMEKLKIENGGSWSRVIFLDDLLGRQQDDNTKTGTTFDSNADSIPPGPNPIRNDLDPNDLAILDMMFCIEATGFIGNMHSSLSRHIIEARQLQSKPWKVF